MICTKDFEAWLIDWVDNLSYPHEEIFPVQLDSIVGRYQRIYFGAEVRALRSGRYVQILAIDNVHRGRPTRLEVARLKQVDGHWQQIWSRA